MKIGNNSFSFLLAFSIHALLFVALFFSFANKDEIPLMSVINVINLDESAKEKKSIKHQDLKPQKNPEKILQHFHEEAARDSKDAIAQKVAPIHNPLPQIPDELRQEAFESSAVARFYIASDGEVLKVDLIKPCANPRLNHLLLKSLKNWKFTTSSTNSAQDIRVNFLVQ